MILTYRHAPQVEPAQAGSRPTLQTPAGGQVLVDDFLLELWTFADGQALDAIERRFAGRVEPQTLRAALACLAEAGLLRRSGLESPTRPLFSLQGELVSAVVVTFNSLEWLDVLFYSLLSQTYRPLEVIVVDNASRDGTPDWIAAHHPEVRLLRLDQPVSLAGAINRGASLAQGEFFLILNPDVRLEPDAVARMVQTALGHPRCGATGAKLKLYRTPSFLNGIGNYVGPGVWGTDLGLGHLDLGQFDAQEELPSACFAALLIPRPAWEAIGPVDEGFPLYYEDVEWCYRARLLGYPVLAAPQAEVAHAFGGHSAPQPEAGLSPRKLYHVTLGRLRFTALLAGKYAPWFFFTYALDDLLRLAGALVRLRLDRPKAYLHAWLDYFRQVPELRRRRKDLQAHRAISDAELFAIQNSVPIPHSWNGLPELTLDLIENEYLPMMRAGKTHPMAEMSPVQPQTRLLILSNDVVDVKMAGPGMRYLEMARALAGPGLQVTLAVPNQTTLQVPGVEIVFYQLERPAGLQKQVETSQVVLVSSYLVDKFPFLGRTRARLVVDLYDPFVLENLHYYLDQPLDAQEEMNRRSVAITNQLARLGDFFICGNERQRDYWLGVLTANGRINPATYRQDSTLHGLLDIVGIGFPDRPPSGPRPLVRGVHPIVPADSQIVLWGGGIWNWLDPLTLVQAWPQVIARHPQARLVFLGTRHPNPLVPPHAMAGRTEALAGEIGEKDRTIAFIEWLPYEQREALLCEADVGVSLHPIHVETRFSQRTRVLDYFWARLPVVLTEGDQTSEWTRQYGLGKVVPPHSPDVVAEALNEILDTPKAAWSAAFEPLQARFRWPQVVEPIRRYCLAGQPAPDVDRQNTASPRLPSNLGRQWKRFRILLRQEGWRVVLHRTWRYLQWQLARSVSKD